MRSVAIWIIGIVYGLSLFLLEVVRHPPRWVEDVAVTTSATREVRLLGHRIVLHLTIEPAGAEQRQSNTPTAAQPDARPDFWRVVTDSAGSPLTWVKWGGARGFKTGVR